MTLEQIISGIKETPYYQDSAVAIYCCDNRIILPQIPDKSIDLVLTDPPYGIDYQSNMRVATKQFNKLVNDNVDITHEYHSIFDKLNSDCIALIFCSFKNYVRDYTALHFADIKNCIVWDKGGGGIGDLEHSLLTDYELILVAHNGNGKIRGKRNGSVWSVAKVNPSAMLHPTEKPFELLGKLVETFCDSGVLILDPFLGSGTTAVCAKKLGRKCIGIEIEEKYCEIAANRCAQEVMDLTIPEKKIEQEAML